MHPKLRLIVLDLSSLAVLYCALAYHCPLLPVQALPLYALVCLGCYCLARLGADLLLFRDFTHRTHLLEQVLQRLAQ